MRLRPSLAPWFKFRKFPTLCRFHFSISTSDGIIDPFGFVVEIYVNP